MNNRPTIKMMDELNGFLLRQGSCLQYVKGEKTHLTIFRLKVRDKFLHSDQCIVNPTNDFDNLVRNWFKIREVDDLGFSNTVKVIYAA